MSREGDSMSWRVIILTTLSPREGLGQPGAESLCRLGSGRRALHPSSSSLSRSTRLTSHSRHTSAYSCSVRLPTLGDSALLTCGHSSFQLVPYLPPFILPRWSFPGRPRG